MDRIVKFKEGHLDFFDFKESIDLKRLDYDTHKHNLVANSRADHIEIYSLICDNEVIAILGATAVMPEFAEVFALFAKNSDKHKLFIHKSVKQLIKEVENFGKTRRLQMVVHCSFDKAVQWAKSLGFEVEGVLRNYGVDKSPFFMMSRIQ